MFGPTFASAAPVHKVALVALATLYIATSYLIVNRTLNQQALKQAYGTVDSIKKKGDHAFLQLNEARAQLRAKEKECDQLQTKFDNLKAKVAESKEKLKSNREQPTFRGLPPKGEESQTTGLNAVQKLQNEKSNKAATNINELCASMNVDLLMKALQSSQEDECAEVKVSGLFSSNNAIIRYLFTVICIAEEDEMQQFLPRLSELLDQELSSRDDAIDAMLALPQVKRQDGELAVNLVGTSGLIKDAVKRRIDKLKEAGVPLYYAEGKDWHKSLNSRLAKDTNNLLKGIFSDLDTEGAAVASGLDVDWENALTADPEECTLPSILGRSLQVSLMEDRKPKRNTGNRSVTENHAGIKLSKYPETLPGALFDLKDSCTKLGIFSLASLNDLPEGELELELELKKILKAATVGNIVLTDKLYEVFVPKGKIETETELDPSFTKVLGKTFPTKLDISTDSQEEIPSSKAKTVFEMNEKGVRGAAALKRAKTRSSVASDKIERLVLFPALVIVCTKKVEEDIKYIPTGQVGILA